MNIGTLASGEIVFVTPESHFFTHPDTHAGIKDALAKLSSADMHVDASGIARPEARIEGKEELTICVPVTASDTFVYSKRAPRTWHTRFVTKREPIKTDTMSLVLRQTEEAGVKKFELITAFWGPQAPREPGDSSLAPGTPEYEEAYNFWETHALVLPSDEAGMRKLGVDPATLKDKLEPGEE